MALCRKELTASLLARFIPVWFQRVPALLKLMEWLMVGFGSCLKDDAWVPPLIKTQDSEAPMGFPGRRHDTCVVTASY